MRKRQGMFFAAAVLLLSALSVTACQKTDSGKDSVPLEESKAGGLSSTGDTEAAGESQNGSGTQGGVSAGADESARSREAEEYVQEVVAAIESQYPDETFTAISEAEIDTSASVFADAYLFAGGRSSSGWEFVAGTCKTKENPLEGMTCATGGGIPGYTTSQFDGGRLLILEKGDSEQSRLSYLYDVLQQGKLGVRYMEEVANRGASLVPPKQGPFLKVSMVKGGYPVTEFLPLDEEEAKELANGEKVSPDEEPGAAAVELMEDRTKLSALEEHSTVVTKQMVKKAEEDCALSVGHSSNIKDLTKAVMKVNLYGEIREETVENRDDLERLAAQFGEVSAETPEFPGIYEGVITMTRQDGMQITVQLARNGGGFVLGNASYRSMPEDNASAVWSVFSTLDGWSRYGTQIRMHMSEPSYAIDTEKLTFTLKNETGKPIQYILSPIFYKEQETKDEDGNRTWKRVDSVAGFCGFLTPMDGGEIELEVPWDGAFVPQGPGTYKMEIQVMPEDELRYEISDTFELKTES